MRIVCLPGKYEKNFGTRLLLSDVYVKPAGSYVSSNRCYLAPVECTKRLAARAPPQTLLGEGEGKLTALPDYSVPPDHLASGDPQEPYLSFDSLNLATDPP